jgi:hypothetical protein
MNKDKKDKKIYFEDDAFDYNRTVEELACLDSIGKAGR